MGSKSAKVASEKTSVKKVETKVRILVIDGKGKKRWEWRQKTS